MACREIRAIRRELDCPNPSLQKVQPHARRKDVCNRRRPLWRDDEFPAVILRGAGAMPVRHKRRRTGRLSRAMTYDTVERGIA